MATNHFTWDTSDLLCYCDYNSNCLKKEKNWLWTSKWYVHYVYVDYCSFLCSGGYRLIEWNKNSKISNRTSKYIWLLSTAFSHGGQDRSPENQQSNVVNIIYISKHTHTLVLSPAHPAFVIFAMPMTHSSSCLYHWMTLLSHYEFSV